jgi:NAD-dependent DNA ligase|tara:strand:+ start:218 stop:499 length:282 start_codon:yes stop_codon:yes gene_type:complete
MFNLKKGDKMSKTNVTFCITGPLKMRRVDVIQEVQNKTNARWISGVSKNTDYLVSARTDTVKARNAKKFGTKVINEAELIAFIKKGKFPSARI